MGYRHLHAIFQLTTMNTAHSNTTCIRAVVQRGNQHLGCALNLLGGRDNLDNLIQQVSNIGGGFVIVFTHPAILGRAIDYREVQLVLCSVQREHEVEDHLVNLLRTTVRLVNLVYYHNRFQANLQCLLQYEACLGHRALEGIDQQQTAIGHVKHALHLATEVRVSRSINDINLCTFPVNTYIL